MNQSADGDPRYDLPLPVRLSNDAEVTVSEEKAEVRSYFLRLAASGAVFEFGEGEYFIITALNARLPLRRIQEELFAKYQAVCSLTRLETFVAELLEMGVLVEASAAAGGASEQQTRKPTQNETRHPFDLGPLDAVLAGAQAQGGQSPLVNDKDPMRGWFRWPLFDPAKLFRFLGYLFYPARWLNWLVPLAALLAGLSIFNRQQEFLEDVKLLSAQTDRLPLFVFSLFAINLVSKVTQGVVTQRYGGQVRFLGLQLFLGFIPRFYVDKGAIKSLPRRGQLWAHGAPLVARLWLFCIGTFVWVTYRQTGTWLSEAGMMLGQAGMFAFVLTAIPLLPIDGYHWLATYIGRPHFQLGAFRLWGMWFRGRVAPEALGGGAKFGMALFAVASVIYTALLVVICYLYLGVVLEGRYRGTGVMMFLVIFTLSLLWFAWARLSIARNQKRLAAQRRQNLPALRNDRSGAVIPFAKAPPARGRGMALGSPQPTQLHAPLPRRRRSYWPKVFWLAVAAFGLWVAFLPYPYEVGGDFQVLPTQRTQAIARADGEIMEVAVREGDWVKAGDLLARLSDWDEQRDLAIASAELEKDQAHLRRLLAGPKPEEVDLAQKQVESVRERVTFSKAEMERSSELAKEKIISDRKNEYATSEYRKALADLSVAQANLQLAKSGATQPDIDAVRAEIKRYQAEVAYRTAELERTRIYAPVSGQVVTANPELLIGRYLRVGEILVEIENNKMAQVEVSVPESDISYVQIGDLVRLKAWAYSSDETHGTVAAIAPSAETKAFGRIVRVKTLVPNADGTIRSEMTGYAKIAGAELPVWKAFSQMILRFFRIEVWSWIP